MRSAILFLVAVVRRDLRPLAVSVIACGIAATVATFQFAVFTSFLRAGAAAPEWLEADAWISDRGVQCFDFPAPFPEDYESVVQSLLPNAKVRRVAVAFAPWISPTGGRNNVAVIGIDDSSLPTRAFKVDWSEKDRLDLHSEGNEASIGPRTMIFAGPTTGLASFLGAPYAVIRFDKASEILQMPQGTVSFLAINFPEGRPLDLKQRLRALEQRYSEIRARTDAEFKWDSSAYWQSKTGAGAAILLAAVLASLLMAILLLNAVGRFVQRRHSDFVSMLGHGAGGLHLAVIIFSVSATVVAGSLAIMFILVPLMDLASNSMLPWVTLKTIDFVFAFTIAAVCLALSVLAAGREIRRFPPDAIFRS